MPRVPATDDAPDGRCPGCGDDLFVSGYGCPRCGHGRPQSATRSPGKIAGLVAVGTTTLGVLLLFTVATVSQKAPWAHLMLFAMSAPFVGIGAYALQRPAGLPLAANGGTDAFGMQQFGRTRPSSAREGLQYGAAMLVAGGALWLLAVFFGALTG